jgi:hypothetical protein
MADLEEAEDDAEAFDIDLSLIEGEFLNCLEFVSSSKSLFSFFNCSSSFITLIFR